MVADQYVSELRFYRTVVRRLIELAAPSEARIDDLTSAVSRFPQPVTATAMTEDWCGDSACVLPFLAPLFGLASIQFVVFRGSEYAEVERYYEDSGDDHIPAVSIWDGEGAEIGRWIEQPKSVLASKERWIADRPEYTELEASRTTDPVAKRQFSQLYKELVEAMAEWYTTGMWDEAAREVIATLSG